MLELLNTRLGQVAGIITSLALILGFVPACRRFAVKVFVVIRGYVTGPLLLQQLAKDVTLIKTEVRHNGGGSMKDAVAALRLSQDRADSYRRHDFWTQGRPAMEMDGHGHANLASEAMVRLFHVSNPEEIYRRSWLRFLDGDDVDDFLRAFIDCAKADSLFRYAVRIVGNNGEDRGQWEFRAGPIKPDIGDSKLYSGHWLPVDETARGLAERHRWANW